MTPSRSLIALAAGLALCAGATAQVVITHAKALAGNVTPGDAPGYPITISQPGSYILKSNLVVPADANGIEIATAAVGVVLDFNGFALAGQGVCTSAVVGKPADQCSGHGYGSGLTSYGDHVVLRNGTVMGFQSGGIVDGGEIAGMAFLHNAQAGLAQGSSHKSLTVMSSRFVMNGGVGLACDRCDVMDSMALRNGSHGFHGTGLEFNVQVTRSSARTNGGLGLKDVLARDSASFYNVQGSGRGDVTSAGGNADQSGVY